MDLVTLPEEFFVSAPPGYGQFQAIKTTLAEWTRITPPAQIDMPGEYSIYNLFGLALPFYLFKVTRPFGFWGSIRKTLAPDSLTEIHAENRRDIIALFFAVPWQVVLFLTGMMMAMKQWSHAGTLAVLLVPLLAGLYWFWYRHLAEEVEYDTHPVVSAATGAGGDGSRRSDPGNPVHCLRPLGIGREVGHLAGPKPPIGKGV